MCLGTGIQWKEASASLYDSFQKKYVKTWGSNCKYDVRFGFESPYLAMQFSGKINDYLRCRYDLSPRKCQMYVGNKTIRVNAWKTDMSMFFLSQDRNLCHLAHRRNCIPTITPMFIK